MKPEQRLVKRAVAYDCAQLNYLAMHNRLVAGMEERDSFDDYKDYEDPDFRHNIDRVRMGIFIARKAPSIAFNSLRLLFTAKRFESSYARQFPEHRPSPQELAQEAVRILTENY